MYPTPIFPRYGEFGSQPVLHSWTHVVTAYSKLANVLYASELQQRLSAEGLPITVMSLHPGASNTFSRRPAFVRISWLVEAFTYFLLDHPDVAAYTSAFAAASPAVSQHADKYKGAYLDPVGVIATPSEAGRSDALARELWAAIETFLAERGI